MIRGTVKWFNDAKGFGFITHDKGDVFVHFSTIEAEGFKTLKDGEEVDYELLEGPKGLNATRVIRLSSQATEQATQSVRGLAAAVEKEIIRDEADSSSSMMPTDPTKAKSEKSL